MGFRMYWYGPVVTSSASTFSDIGAPSSVPDGLVPTRPTQPDQEQGQANALENGVAHDGIVTFKDSRANDQEHDHNIASLKPTNCPIPD